jgi:hypothetical protein
MFKTISCNLLCTHLRQHHNVQIMIVTFISAIKCLPNQRKVKIEKVEEK